MEAQYDGLQDHRVAVVCLSDSSMYAGQLSQSVERLLATHVPDIETVPQVDVYGWLDANDWNELDFAQLGKGVDAEFVVAIELDSFRLYDGMTMYKGRADVVVSVHDVAKKGEVVFRTSSFQFEFPNSTPFGHHRYGRESIPPHVYECPGAADCKKFLQLQHPRGFGCR